MIRLAAVGDIHLDASVAGQLRPALERLAEEADVLLLAGDLTRHGTVEEAAVVADELAGLAVPVISVLGNHDYQSDDQDRVRKVLEDAGLQVLEGEAAVLTVGRRRVGVAGAKGFGLGFAGRNGSDFGEPEQKAWSRHGRETAGRLAYALRQLDGTGVESVVALTHFSPVEDTLVGEPREIWPFLGNYLLAEAIDGAGAALAVHGHAHLGAERGRTPSGVPVRNVAQPVLGRPYAVYRLDERGALDP